MKTRIYARVIAEPISFPDVVGIRLACLDGHGNETGEGYKGIRFTWQQVQNHFWIDPAYAKNRESHLKNGASVALKDCYVHGKFYEKGEAIPVLEDATDGGD